MKKYLRILSVFLIFSFEETSLETDFFSKENSIAQIYEGLDINELSIHKRLTAAEIKSNPDYYKMKLPEIETFGNEFEIKILNERLLIIKSKFESTHPRKKVSSLSTPCFDRWKMREDVISSGWASCVRGFGGLGFGWCTAVAGIARQQNIKAFEECLEETYKKD